MITPNSFALKKHFNGLRRDVADTFGNAFVLNLGGDVRDDPRLSGPRNNIFGIQLGVAVSIWEPALAGQNFKLRYQATEPLATRWEKDSLVLSLKSGWSPPVVMPDDKANWVNMTDSDWDELLQLCSKDVKLGRSKEGVLFGLYSLGVVTNRDEWMYDFSPDYLEAKVRHFISVYEYDRLGWATTRSNFTGAAKLNSIASFNSGWNLYWNCFMRANSAITSALNTRIANDRTISLAVITWSTCHYLTNN